MPEPITSYRPTQRITDRFRAFARFLSEPTEVARRRGISPDFSFVTSCIEPHCNHSVPSMDDQRVANVLRDSFCRFVSGDSKEALSRLKEHGSDPRLVQGRATILALVSLLSEQQEDIDAAVEAQDAAAAGRKSSIGWLGKRSDESKDELSEDWRSLLRGESNLFRALILFRSGAMIRGGLALRSAFKDYACVIEKAERGEGDPLFVSSGLFGAGFFLFGCSMIPSQYHWLILAAGFSIQRRKGLELLRKCEEMDTAWSCLARLTLLFLAKFFFEDDSLTAARLIEAKALFPESPVVDFIAGYASRKSGELENSLRQFQRASENSIQLRQFSLSCQYETGASYFLMLRFDVASEALEAFLKETKAPSFRCYAAYQCGISWMMLNRPQKAYTALKLVESFRRKNYSWDDYSFRKAEAHLLNECILSDNERTLINVSLLVEGRQFERAKEILNAFEPENVNQKAESLFCRAECGASILDFEKVINLCKQESESLVETWIAPHAWVEIAEIHFKAGEFKMAQHALMEAKQFASYDFRKPLTRRMDGLAIQYDDSRRASTASSLSESEAIDSPFLSPEEDEEDWKIVVAQYQSEELARQWTVSDSAFNFQFGDEEFETAEDEEEDETRVHERGASGLTLSQAYNCLARLDRVTVRKGLKSISDCVPLDNALECLSDANSPRLFLWRLVEGKALSFVGPSLFVKTADAFLDTPSAKLKECHLRFNTSSLNLTAGKVSDTPITDARILMVRILDTLSSLSGSSPVVRMTHIPQTDAWSAFKELVAHLSCVNLDILTITEKRLFFCCLYNVLAFHAQVLGIVPDRIRRMAFFKTTRYNVSGMMLSLDDIEHGILRGNAKRGASRQFLESDPRLVLVLPADERIHFALACGLFCCGVSMDEKSLDECTAHYLKQTVRLDGHRLWISRLFKWYASDFPQGAANYVAQKMAVKIPAANVNISYASYDMSLVGPGFLCTVLRGDKM